MPTISRRLCNRAILEGIKVVDFSRVLAAPFASMLLGDLGAEVWKIEKPGTGDDTRSWLPPSIHSLSCYYVAVNRNKKSIAIDLAKPRGRELALSLATKADVLLENFRTGTMDKFGIDYTTLSRLNNRLIYCSVTGYGSTGPYAADPGYDVIAEAVGGFMGITGPRSSSHKKNDGDSHVRGEPCKAGVAVTDLATGLFSHGAILAALYHREKTGVGQRIECNLLSTQLAMLTNVASNYLNAGMEGRPMGTEHESIVSVPYQAFRTRDNRHYVVGAGNDKAFQHLCAQLELPAHVATSPKFATNKDRVANREELLSILAERFAQQNLEHWRQRLRSDKYPSGPVNTPSEAFEHEQVKHLQLVRCVDHPSYGQVNVVGHPVKYSRVGEANNEELVEEMKMAAPPTLGEHTREVLSKELNIDDAEMERLKAGGVIDY